jgi:membrane fusion protein (multidrug efflux system)
LAEILFERDGKLIKQNSIPQSQYDQSRADLARAKAQLAETEARLKNKRIQAPFDGALGIRQVNLGDYVSPGTVIATLQDASELEIDFTLPARYAPELHKGLLIELQVSAHADRTFNAELVALDSRVDTGTRSLLARAMLKETQGLLPGMFAILRINLDQQVDVITVPQTAVTYSLQGNVVYVVEQREAGGLTAVSRIVTVGEVREGRAAILSGLAAGEEIVTVGQNKLFRNVEILIDKDVRL